MGYNWEKKDWPNFSFSIEGIEQKLYQFTEMIGEVTGVLKSLPDSVREETKYELLISEAMKTSEIEGAFFSRQDVMSSVKNNLGLGEKMLFVRDKRASAITDLLIHVKYNFQDELSVAELWKWHEILFRDANGLNIGCWREGSAPMQVVSGGIGMEEVHFEAPSSKKVPSEMKRFIIWFNDTAPGKSREIVDPVIRAAIAHLYFESIHPFEDGNGRIGRALAEKALSQTLGRPVLLSLSKSIEANKSAYYNALKEAQQKNEISSWLSYFVTLTLNAQKEAQELIDFTLRKTIFFDHFRYNLNERQLKVVNRMFEAGPGGFEGGMTAKKYMVIAKTSKATATRDLQELIDLDVFNHIGESRAMKYDIRAVYAIAFYPSTEIIKEVAGLKNTLKNKIGNYASSDAEAHITISQLFASDRELDIVKNCLSSWSKGQKPFEVKFNDIKKYDNGTLFIAPDEHSTSVLSAYMKSVHKNIKIKEFHHTKAPHMSIGRKLSAEHIETAFDILPKVDLNFWCDRISLRKLKGKHFERIEDFVFLNQPINEQQTQLFNL
ncbi:DUF4172 domain-containing protein [Pedobacter sp.]|uniref:DUF4172 domain-containing protein n=1 Tax=Pedobacter sp. TaxID=1411316 RepID=UPI003BA8D615